MDLLSTSQILLRDAVFSVHLTFVGGSPIACFEDDALIGFCCTFSSPQELIDRWKVSEGEILRQFAPQIRVAGDKAWNVYCIFLCSTPAEGPQKRIISWIEEDLERTRKIAACGIASREDLVRALLPLLPIQHQPILQSEDATARLRRRITDIAPRSARAVLDATIPASETIRLLGERS